MTFEDTVFEPATPKGAKPAKKKVLPADMEVGPTTDGELVAPVKKRRRRGPNKVKASNPYDDLRQVITLFKGFSKAQRKNAMNLLAIMFDD